MNDLPDTRRTLIEQLRAEESGAWVTFAALYEPAIYTVAVKMGLQHVDALDVSQEVMAKIHRKIGEWDANRTDGRFRGWLHRLTTNAAIDLIRARKRQVVASGDTGVQHLLEQQPPPTEHESSLLELEHRREVFHHVADLVRTETTEPAWRSFWRTSVEGAAPRDVAHELGVSVGSVYAHKCRVLARIRSIVQGLVREPRANDQEAV